MTLIINDEPYTNGIPPFNAAYWKKNGETYDLILQDGGETVLTFHDIAENERGIYRIDSGEIPMLPEEITPDIIMALINEVIDVRYQLALMEAQNAALS